MTEYKPHAFHHTRQTPINTRSDRNIIAPTLISISVYGTGGVLVSLSQISKWIELVPTLETLFRCTRYKIEQKPVRAPACYLLSKLAFFRKKAQEQVPLSWLCEAVSRWLRRLRCVAKAIFRNCNFGYNYSSDGMCAIQSCHLAERVHTMCLYRSQPQSRTCNHAVTQ